MCKRKKNVTIKLGWRLGIWKIMKCLKRQSKKVVIDAKVKPYEDLYNKLGTMEGERYF